MRVNLPPIELSVEPSSLKFILGTTETVTVGVNADARAANATIEITQNLPNIVLIENNFDDSGEITVTGLSVGEIILTIEANAFDYATETTQVSVTVQSPLFIVAPATFDLEEGSTQAINVGLSRIAEDSGSVTVMIEPEEGSELELTVSPSSLTFVTTELQQVIVTSINDDDEYTDDRNAMLTLTADGYTTATVTANITDDEPQPIGLDVTGSTNLSLVRFTNTEITVSVGVAADLTVTAEGAVRLAGDRTLVRTNLVAMGSTRIEISGAGEGDGTVQIHSQRSQEGNRYGSGEC